MRVMLLRYFHSRWDGPIRNMKRSTQYMVSIRQFRQSLQYICSTRCEDLFRCAVDERMVWTRSPPRASPEGTDWVDVGASRSRMQKGEPSFAAHEVHDDWPGSRLLLRFGKNRFNLAKGLKATQVHDSDTPSLSHRDWWGGQ